MTTIVLNYVFIAVLAFIAEYYRYYKFHISKVFNITPPGPTVKQDQSGGGSADKQDDKQAEKDKKASSHEDIIAKIKSEPLKEMFQMHTSFQKGKKDIEQQTVESEKHNNQDEYAKYAKMQRQLVKMQKQHKTLESEVAEKLKNLTLEDREKFQKLIEGKDIDDMAENKPENTGAQNVEQRPGPQGASLINHGRLASSLCFFTVFYFIPIVVFPYFCGKRHEYFVFTKLYLVWDMEQIEDYYPQLPTLHAFEVWDFDPTWMTPGLWRVAAAALTPLSSMFEILKRPGYNYETGEETEVPMSMMKLHCAYIVAMVFYNRIFNCIAVLRKL